ncbi:MAG TPA: 6-phosphogluconolactonase, partial [Mesotoga sp.]|nr:6-phosphogluconolactonase [Mesotoga sp.]
MTLANRKLSIFDNFEQLSNAAAGNLAKLIENRIAVQERFSVALSGGSTPGRLYEILAEEPYKESISWQKVDLFWVDERCVNPDDDESNYGLVKELLLRKIEIPE